MRLDIGGKSIKIKIVGVLPYVAAGIDGISCEYLGPERPIRLALAGYTVYTEESDIHVGNMGIASVAPSLGYPVYVHQFMIPHVTCIHWLAKTYLGTVITPSITLIPCVCAQVVFQFRQDLCFAIVDHVIQTW